MPKDQNLIPNDADPAQQDPTQQTDPIDTPPAGDDGGEGGTGGEGGGQADPRDEKKYSDAELDDIIAKKLASKRAAWEKEFRAQLEKEKDDGVSEAEKLKGMTDLQRAQYEAQKYKKELEEKQAHIDFAEQMSIARSELSDAGITFGDELLSMFVSPDADKTMSAIEKLKELWPNELNAAVQNALKRTPPAAETNPAQKSYGTEYAEKYNQKMNGGK